jgi:transposase
VICVDEMGPESAKSFAGQQLVNATKRPAERATQEIDYGRRGKGYIFGAFQPATGEAFTQDYARRTIANWVDFLEQIDQQLAPEIERIYAILDNLNTHHADDVLLFCVRHPRWEFVFQPTYAAYLNLIEPWWKVLRSLALKGRRFETWEELAAAVRAATRYRHAHKHPFLWGQCRRHRPVRRAGIGLVPTAA